MGKPMRGPLKHVELYGRKGRPCLYDFNSFLNPKTSCIVINCEPTQKIYNSIKSSFARWRKQNGMKPGFVFDIYETHVIIWKRINQKQG